MNFFSKWRREWIVFLFKGMPDFSFNKKIIFEFKQVLNMQNPNLLEGRGKIIFSDLVRVQFWKNDQHESCRSRSELSGHIKIEKKRSSYEEIGSKLIKVVRTAVKFKIHRGTEIFFFRILPQKTYIISSY